MVDWFEMTPADYTRKRERVNEMRVSKEGLFTVIGIDMFDNSEYPKGKYKTSKTAFEVARRERRCALRRASGPDIADRYYVYDSQGNYLGAG